MYRLHIRFVGVHIFLLCVLAQYSHALWQIRDENIRNPEQRDSDQTSGCSSFSRSFIYWAFLSSSLSKCVSASLEWISMFDAQLPALDPPGADSPSSCAASGLHTHVYSTSDKTSASHVSLETFLEKLLFV